MLPTLTCFYSSETCETFHSENSVIKRNYRWNFTLFQSTFHFPFIINTFPNSSLCSRNPRVENRVFGKTTDIELQYTVIGFFSPDSFHISVIPAEPEAYGMSSNSLGMNKGLFYRSLRRRWQLPEPSQSAVHRASGPSPQTLDRHVVSHLDGQVLKR